MARAACLLALVIGFGVLAAGCDDKPCVDFGLFLVRADGSGQDRIRPHGGLWPKGSDQVDRARWSADGSRLVVQPGDICPGPLLTLRPDGSDAQLSPSDDLGFDAAGTSLAWSGYPGEPTGFSISRPGAPPRLVQFAPGFSIYPCSLPEGAAPQVSPDGKFVAYAEGHGSPQATDLYLLAANSQGVGRRLMHTDQGNAIQSIVWSPDSHTIAVTRDDGIYLMNVNRPRPRFLADSGTVAWSPDGRRLALAADDLDLVDRHGTLLRHLVKSSNGIADVSWSPASSIAYTQDTGDNNQSKCNSD